MGFGIRLRLADILESGYRRLARLEALPPLHLRAHVGRLEDYERVPEEFIAYLKLLCGLTMEDHLLDVGCGSGRFARHLLAAPHLFPGKYRGFDVDRKSIAWAKEHITANHANFEFSHVDMLNTVYSPHGTVRPENYTFEYANNEFDVAFAISVFTHLLPDTTINYMKEIARVLRPGGKVLMTFFLLDEYPEKLNKHSLTTWKDFLNYLGVDGRWYHHGDYSVISESAPEAITAYQTTAMTKILEEAGLRIEAIHRGRWSTLENVQALSMQDIVIAST
jgi:SAM-dependent methyltransferase